MADRVRFDELRELRQLSIYLTISPSILRVCGVAQFVMRRADRQIDGGSASGALRTLPRGVVPHQASRGGFPRAVAPPPPERALCAERPGRARSRFFVKFAGTRPVASRSRPDAGVPARDYLSARDGNVQALPAWPDTVRIVTHYAVIARIDATPCSISFAGAWTAAGGGSRAPPPKRQQQPLHGGEKPSERFGAVQGPHS